jgi:DNA-binding transcriptional ArsR family regulator
MKTIDTSAQSTGVFESSADSAAQVFQAAADLFSVLSTPMRLKILSVLCHGELTVSQMLAQIDSSQPNLSQHLNVLYRSGILTKRKEGTQMIYRIQSERAMLLCRSVCTQIAIELDEPAQIAQGDRLLAHTLA